MWPMASVNNYMSCIFAEAMPCALFLMKTLVHFWTTINNTACHMVRLLNASPLDVGCIIAKRCWHVLMHVMWANSVLRGVSLSHYPCCRTWARRRAFDGRSLNNTQQPLELRLPLAGVINNGILTQLRGRFITLYESHTSLWRLSAGNGLVCQLHAAVRLWVRRGGWWGRDWLDR